MGYFYDKKAKKLCGEFKQKAIEDMLKNKLGYNETQQKHGLSKGSVQRWERIYRKEGFSELYIERRGRACAAGGSPKGRPPKLQKQVEEDLIGENQRLRAEVDYLKKLHALMSKMQRPENGRK